MFDMSNFSGNHLVVIFLFALFLLFCPKLIKNMLPYSYFIENILSVLLIFSVVLDQMVKTFSKEYSVGTSMPIETSFIVVYLAFAIFIFKKYHLFNVFFSWSIVSTFGEIWFFRDPDTTFFSIESGLFLFTKCLIIYCLIYMTEVRKFKINSSAVKDNLIACTLYFPLLFILNKLTNSNYPYAFLNYNAISILIFCIVTSIIYIPVAINDELNLKGR
jgi:hypothetical integral membrane protein (TIGR02206 family)